MGLNYKSTLRYWDDRIKNGQDLYSPNMCFVGFQSYAKYRDYLERKILSRYLEVKPGSTILDLGCGTGRLGIYFASSAKKVKLVDYSSSLLSIGKQYCKVKGIKNVSHCISDVRYYEDKSRYDLIILGGVLMCLNDKDVKALLKKTTTMLAKDGQIVIRDSVSNVERIIKNHYTVYRSFKMIQEMLTGAGYTVKKEFISYNPGLIFELYLKCKVLVNHNHFWLKVISFPLDLLIHAEKIINMVAYRKYLNFYLALRERRNKNFVIQKTLIIGRCK